MALWKGSEEIPNGHCRSRVVLFHLCFSSFLVNLDINLHSLSPKHHDEVAAFRNVLCKIISKWKSEVVKGGQLSLQAIVSTTWHVLLIRGSAPVSRREGALRRYHLILLACCLFVS